MNYRKSIFFAAVVLILGLLSHEVLAQNYSCGDTPYLSGANYNGKLIFVRYSNSGSDDLPTWADSFAQSMQDYYAWVSKGHFQVNLNVLRRLDQTEKAWSNPNASSYYSNYCGAGVQTYGNASAWAIQAIHDHYATMPGGNQDVWNGVDFIIIVHYNSVFGGGNQLGIGNLGLPVSGFSASAYGSNGVGASVMLNGCYAMNASQEILYMQEAVIHEFGHLLFGAGHDPNTWDPGLPAAPTTCQSSCGHPTNPNFINMGNYSVMDSWSPPASLVGFKAYHPMNLISRNWLEQITVYPSSTIQTFDLADVRSASGKALKVLIPGSDQYFLVLNHQGNGYDQVYGGNGLLIWHIWPDHAWDLESRLGKNTAPPGASGPPDPNTWWDYLESEVCHNGSSDDFFHAGQTFGPSTNPNTNMYGSSYQVQPNPSGVTISARQGTGNNLLVDISRSQGIYLPAAGSRYTNSGNPSTINCGFVIPGSPLRIYLSDASGTNFTLIQQSVPNDGSFNMAIPEWATPGTSYKVRVDNYQDVTLDSSPFTIWELQSANMRLIDQTAQSRTFRLSWATSAPTYGVDGATIISPLDSYSTPVGGITSNGLLTHIVDIVTSDCSTDWQFMVSSTNNGANTSTVSSPYPPPTTTVCSCLAYMDFTLSGPEELEPTQVGTFTISGIVGGSPPYTFSWKKGSTCAGPNWSSFGSNSTSANTRPLNGTSFCVKGTVTDSQGKCQQKFLHVAVNEPEPPGSSSAGLIFALHNVSPDPASGPTRIAFDLPEAARVSLHIYDLAGREIASRPVESYPAGRHNVVFDVSNLTAGVYFYRLTAGDFIASRKMLVLNR